LLIVFIVANIASTKRSFGGVSYILDRSLQITAEGC
jgi:hypothetical protein